MPDKIRLCATEGIIVTMKPLIIPTYKPSAFGRLSSGQFLADPVAIAAVLRATPEGV
jgi:hypothetical protein